MTTITIKGRDYTPVPVKDSHDRRALQFKNNIIAKLRKLGLTDDDIEIELEPARRNTPASATWYLTDRRLYYSCGVLKTYADNLSLVSRVIDAEVQALLDEQQPLEEFISKFTEEKGVEEERVKAREVLGLSAGEKDMDVINKAYKDLARTLHPDTDTGDIDKFKLVNNAHKTLKRELN